MYGVRCVIFDKIFVLRTTVAVYKKNVGLEIRRNRNTKKKLLL